VRGETASPARIRSPQAFSITCMTSTWRPTTINSGCPNVATSPTVYAKAVPLNDPRPVDGRPPYDGEREVVYVPAAAEIEHPAGVSPKDEKLQRHMVNHLSTLCLASSELRARMIAQTLCRSLESAGSSPHLASMSLTPLTLVGLPRAATRSAGTWRRRRRGCPASCGRCSRTSGTGRNRARPKRYRPQGALQKVTASTRGSAARTGRVAPKDR